jgi:monoterpene epsilon-lactone hydrolase
MSEPKKTFPELLEKAAVPPESLGDMTVLRPIYEEFMLQTPAPSDVSITEVELGGVLALEVAAPEASADAALLFFHGGVFAMGSPRSSANLAGQLSRQARAKVFSVEYRLAPENPFPAAPEDALESYRGLLESGISQERIALFGESAGGALALSTMVGARDAGLPQPAAGVLYSPWVDLTLSGSSMDSKASADYLLAREALQGAVYGYAGGADPSNPKLSPLFDDLHGIAPLHIQCGSFEVLLDDATRLAAAAAAADVAVQLDVTPEMPHVFQASAPEVPEAVAALERTGSFLRSRLALAR